MTKTSAQGQYLTFVLGKEIFALDISKVREVLEITKVSEIPRTPKYMRGVINLRGHAVPVVEMRTKLGMERIDDTVDTCIIILEVLLEDELLAIGALVDSVREVVEMPDREIEAAPKMGSAINADYIKGMGRQGDNFVIIVDVDSVFSKKELQVASEVSGSREEVAA
ncbi:chemotaxis protein CheW [Pseudodesulfovibrio senegalensis]|uniref:Chemotaxis protein CheW n=1 Tax=Pseudodesulfovibrio senegalensis TaxID=1721087 RepID=A0A6N6N263_9BACT|nr:chemotaxis protein CheW [Pseudodesulfovibrio senegalensis]KAB1441076.1 chemotaxis protein CheW [Pseudodesulfovibrio senegalensis]